MNIRTAEQLHDVLSEDLVWRRKELTSYRFALQTFGSQADRRDAFLRGAVALLYAHWEGYVKRASNAYLEFVAAQRLLNRELALPMLAVSIRPLLRQATESRRVRNHIAVAEFFIARLDERSTVPYRDAIATKANLSSRVLREIVDTLGLDFSPFEAKAVLLDEGLLERRNTIAHGEFLTVTPAAYFELSDAVVSMLDEFTTQVVNAAALKRYRAA